MNHSLTIDARKIKDDLEQILASGPKDLKKLEIYHYKQNTFDADLARFLDLEFIRIHGRLEVLPQNIFLLKNLKKIDLSKNNLNFNNDIDKFSIISRPTAVFLSKNNIMKLPSYFSDLLEDVEELVLNGNKLNDLPFWFSHLKNLKRLSLDSNHFDKIPECLFDLPKLNYLSFDHNNLHEFELRKLRKLCPLHEA